MSVSREALLHAIEISFIALPVIPSKSEALDIPGVQGRWSPLVAHPFSNLVGVATLNNDSADSTIRQVYEFFAGDGRAFGWLVGPESTPGDLPRRLEAAGIAKIHDGAGMALTDLSLPIHENPAVHVRRATPDDTADVIRLYTEAYPIPETFSEIWDKLIVAAGGYNYLAFMDGVESPVSVASMYYMSDAPIVALQGAATLPDYRGRGTYTALMAKRLADARAEGMEAAVLQAIRATSAPICAKLGFSEIATADFYGWIPKG